MKKVLCTVLLLFLLSCSSLNYFRPNLQSEMTRLNINTIMIVKSEAIDEYPLWSSDSRFVAVNVMGKWYKFDLKNITLSEIEWNKLKIGFIVNEDTMSDLSTQELKKFNLNSKNEGREIIISDSKKIELKLRDFSSSLVIKKNNEQPTILWRSNMENCHSLSLSPDKKYIAYICELSGLFVIKVD